jgi:hypothetical protein
MVASCCLEASQLLALQRLEAVPGGAWTQAHPGSAHGPWRVGHPQARAPVEAEDGRTQPVEKAF